MFQWCIDCLTNAIRNYNDDDDIYIGIEAAIEKLTHYYDDMSPMVGIALALDPSKKYKYLDTALSWEKEWVDSVKTNFAGSFDFYKRKATTKSPSISTIPSKRTHNYIDDYASWELARLGIGIAGDSHKEREEEYTIYFNLPPRSTPCILSYWKDKKETYPALASMAKDYLTVQASSVPSERAFSSGTDFTYLSGYFCDVVIFVVSFLIELSASRISVYNDIRCAALLIFLS
jgi:hypothetical protein